MGRIIMSEAEYFEDIGGDFATLDFYAEHPEVFIKEKIEMQRKAKFRDEIRRLQRKGITDIYLVIADSRKKANSIIYLQNVKYTGGFWTQYLSNARLFENRENAEFVCRHFKYNNPRVISLREIEKKRCVI